MTPHVHKQQQSVPTPKELIERLTEEQTSVNKPTLGEIEDAVNYLISLHNQKQKKRNNSFWTKCISCFGLQRKPLKAKHIDKILSSLKRGIIPMELTLIVSIQRWEKERTVTGNSKNLPSSSQVLSELKQEPETTNSQEFQKQYHSTLNSVSGEFLLVAEKHDNADNSETASEVVDVPTPISTFTSKNTNEEQGISRTTLRNEQCMMQKPNFGHDDFNFSEISLINNSCLVQTVIFTIIFAIITLCVFNSL